MLIDVDEAVARTRRGDLLIVVDDAARENEGDLFVAAAHATAERLNVLIRRARGLVCVPMTGERLDDLLLPPMVSVNTAAHGTAFTVPVDAADGTTTGISAYDRAVTVQTLLDPATQPDQLLRPGHVFPLRSAAGGVLERAGHTEAAVELARLAGLPPAGVICEVLSEDGGMARMAELERLAEELGIGIISVAQIVAYRQGAFEVARRSDAALPTRHGSFTAHDYEDLRTGEHHVALVLGDVGTAAPVLVRVHSECLTGDAFGSLRCDCGEQLSRALDAIASAGHGVLVYLRQEGRGIGLPGKLRAYALQDAGYDTVEANVHQGFPADARDFSIAARMLLHLGVRQARLLTNNPDKVTALVAAGIATERVPLVVPANSVNLAYLQTKRDKLGHVFDVLTPTLPSNEAAYDGQTRQRSAAGNQEPAPPPATTGGIGGTARQLPAKKRDDRGRSAANREGEEIRLASSCA